MVEIDSINLYIQNCPKEHHQRLEELREIILASAPKETKEAITYKLPTFKYKGNLIHFGLFKNHIGIYPGTSAIEHFAEDLQNFKTSKGAIQIPFGVLPKELIERIVKWNVERKKTIVLE